MPQVRVLGVRVMAVADGPLGPVPIGSQPPSRCEPIRQGSGHVGRGSWGGFGDSGVSDFDRDAGEGVERL